MKKISATRRPARAPVTVRLKGFNQAKLALTPAGGGQIVQKGGKYYLKGAWRLRTPLWASNTDTFDPDGLFKAEVSKVSDDVYDLISAVAHFKFPGDLRPNGPATSPVLTLGTLKLEAYPHLPFVKLIEDKASLSWVAAKTPTGDNRLWLPVESRAGGYALGSPEMDVTSFPDGTVGNYLREVDGLLCFVCGGPLTEIKIKARPGASISLSPQSQIITSLEKGGGVAQSIATATSPQPANLLRLWIDRTVGLNLEDGDPATGDRQAVGGRKIRAGMDWLVVEGMAKTRLEVAVGAPGGVAKDATVLLSAPETRFGFYMPLMAPTKAAAVAPMFLYRDARQDGGGASSATLADRYDGVLLRSLPRPTGVGVWLDASFAAVEIQSGVGGMAARLRAGHDWKDWPALAGRAPPALLLSKPDTNLRRQLTIPIDTAKILSQAPGATRTPLRLDLTNGAGQLELTNPLVLAAPLGMASGKGAASETLKWLRLTPKAGTPLHLALSPGKVHPQAGRGWLKAFTPADDSYAVAQHPGLTLDVAPARAKVKAGQVTTNLTVDVERKGTAEAVVYGALGLGAVYGGVVAFKGRQYVDRLIDDLQSPGVKLTFEHLSIDPGLPADVRQRLKARNEKMVVRNEGIDDLLLVVSATTPPGLGADAFADFVHGLLGGPPKPTDVGGGWSLMSSLAVQLYAVRQVGGKPTYVYAPALAVERGAPAGSTGLAIDFSSDAKGVIDLDRDLGWKNVTYGALARTSPALWPRASGGQNGALLDPSDRAWRGFFFRNMPLVLDLDPAILAKLRKHAPIAATMVESINGGLLLDYGWRDEAGATWSARFKPASPIQLMPDVWKDVFELSFEEFTSTGARSKMVTADGAVTATLGWIRDEHDQPVVIKTKFGIDLEAEKPVPMVEVGLPGGQVKTKSFPGFESVAFERFVTDFSLARIDLSLTPDARLADILPIFNGKEPLRASLTIPLGESKPVGRVECVLPTERTVQLAGKWAFSVQGMEVVFDGDTVVVRVHGRLNLSLSGAVALGGRLELRKKGADWTFDVLLDRVDANVRLSGFELEGHLAWLAEGGWTESWAKAVNGELPVDANDLAAAKARDFYGYLAVKGAGGLLNIPRDTTKPPSVASGFMAVKVGARDQRPYWVAALGVPSLKIGGVGVEDPVLVLARNADTKTDNLLTGGLAKLERDALGALRPNNASPGEMHRWLEEWSYKEDVGTALVLSGYLSFKADLAAAPKKPKWLSGLAVTEAGLARLDGAFQLASSLDVQFAAALDIPNRTFRSRFNIGEFHFPAPPPNNQYSVKPGEMLLGFSWGAGNTSFELGVGFPTNTGGDPLQLDWSNSTMLYVRSMWPLNTFWGGFKISFREGTGGHVYLGWAVRAGWTGNFAVTKSNLLDARARVELALGSVTELKYLNAKEAVSLAPPRIGAAGRADAELRALASELAAAKFNVQARWTADVHGSVRGYILGMEIASISVDARVVLHVCGPDARDDNKIIGIAQGYASFGMTIKIGCDKIRIRGSVHVMLVDGQCAFTGAAAPRLTLAAPCGCQPALTQGGVQ